MACNDALEEIIDARKLFTGISTSQLPAHLSFDNARFRPQWWAWLIGGNQLMSIFWEALVSQKLFHVLVMTFV